MRFSNTGINIIFIVVMEEQTISLGLKMLSLVQLHPLRYRLREKVFTASWMVFSILNVVICFIGLKDIDFSDVPLLAKTMEGIIVLSKVGCTKSMQGMFETLLQRCVGFSGYIPF